MKLRAGFFDFLFRSATVEYYETEKIPKIQANLGHKEKKEEMAKALLI